MTKFDHKCNDLYSVDGDKMKLFVYEMYQTLKVVHGDCLSPNGGTRNRFMAF